MVVFLGGSFLENKIKMLTSTGKFFLIFEYLNSKIHFFSKFRAKKNLISNLIIERKRIFDQE